jgi:predicted nucleotide-binding protein
MWRRWLAFHAGVLAQNANDHVLINIQHAADERNQTICSSSCISGIMCAGETIGWQDMAARKPPTPPVQANLTADQMRKGITRLERVIAKIEAFDVAKVTKRFGPDQTSLEKTIEGDLVSIFGHDTVEYRRYCDAISLDHGGIVMSFDGPSDDGGRSARKYVAEGKEAAIQTLKSAINWLHDEIGDAVESESVLAPARATSALLRKIFIVHGHDDGARQTVARFIERIGFEAIILSEQANQGRTIIEKIEAHGDVGFAVVLLTPDDVGGKTVDTLRQRARQNVLLELGYFIGVLGRKCVCTLTKGDLEIPTDFAGVVWEQLDDAGAWKQALSRELVATGYTIDWNKVMS